MLLDGERVHTLIELLHDRLHHRVGRAASPVDVRWSRTAHGSATAVSTAATATTHATHALPGRSMPCMNGLPGCDSCSNGNVSAPVSVATM